MGLVSYPLYLIHNNVGVGLMNAFKKQALGGWCVLEPFLLILLMVGTSWLIFNFWEKPAQKWLGRRLSLKKPEELPAGGLVLPRAREFSNIEVNVPPAVPVKSR